MGPNKTLHVRGDAITFNDLSQDNDITSKLTLILNNNGCQDNNWNERGQKLVGKELEYKQSDRLDVLLPSAQIGNEKSTKKEMERLLSHYLAPERFCKVEGRNAFKNYGDVYHKPTWWPSEEGHRPWSAFKRPSRIKRDRLVLILEAY